MITRITTNGYRCLRHVDQELSSFHVLIGPNASGKTSFLDTLGFLGRMVSDGVEAACEERSMDFRDLLWNRTGDSFELAVEASFPKELRTKLAGDYESIRYEVRIGPDERSNRPGVLEEAAWLQLKQTGKAPEQRTLFPIDSFPPNSVFVRSNASRLRVFSKAQGGNDNYYVETRPRGKKSGRGSGWFPSIKLGPFKSTLANLPADEDKFPVSTWFKNLLSEGVSRIALNGLQLRRPSPVSRNRGFEPDGSNLPWVVHRLESKENRRLYEWWIEHIQTALPELENVSTRERPEDRSRYLVLHYRGGLEVPSWVASDGTLRLLALTLLAYAPDFSRLCLIEEPENGIHPKAAETVYQALSNVNGAQILLATHSPVVLGMADPSKILCFRKTEQGATDIVRGDLHPALRDWKDTVNVGELYAGGVL